MGEHGRTSQAPQSEVKEEDQRLCSLSSYRCAEGVLKVRFSMLRFTGGDRGRMSCAIACTVSTPAPLLQTDAEQRARNSHFSCVGPTEEQESTEQQNGSSLAYEFGVKPSG